MEMARTRGKREQVGGVWKEKISRTLRLGQREEGELQAKS